MSKLIAVVLLGGFCDGILVTIAFYTWYINKKLIPSLTKPSKLITISEVGVTIQNAIDLKYTCNFCSAFKTIVDKKDLEWTHHCTNIPPEENN